MTRPEPASGRRPSVAVRVTTLVTSGRLVEALPLAVLLVAGVALRTVLLGQQQLFRDEATSWYLASHSLGDMLGLAANETAPPLYLLLLKGWMAAFGDSEAALRSLSVVAGIGTIGVTWRWAGDALGRTGALVAAALVALSPAMVAADREARMYSLETLLATLAWWLVWLIVARGGEWSARRRAAAAVGLVLGVAGEVWTMSLGLPVAGLQLAFAVFGLLWLRTRVSAIAAGCVLLGVLSLAPWLPNLLAVASNGQRFWTPRPDLGSAADTLSYWLSLRLGGLWWLGAGLAAAGAALGLAAASRGLLSRPSTDIGDRGAVPGGVRRDRLLAVAIALGMGLVPAVWIYSQLNSVYDPRYLGAAYPPFAIAIAAGVVSVARKARSQFGANQPVPARALAILVVLALVCGIAIPASVAVDDSSHDKEIEPARQVVATLSGLVHPGDVVITLNAQTYFPLRYYLRDGELERSLGTSLYDWHRPSAAFFTGWKDIDDTGILEPATVARQGWRETVHIGPRSVFWLVTLVDPDREFSVFEPLSTGEMRETGRFDVKGAGRVAQIRSAVLVEP